MKRHRLLSLLVLALLMVSAMPVAAQGTGGAGPAPGSGPVVGVGPFARDTAVALKGTSHLWIADELGTLHWAGDTRALATQKVSIATRVEVSFEQLRNLPRGAPWLSAGLVKIGDPIYLPKWESSDAQPSLLRIQSLGDLQIFGIDGSNFNSLVLDKAAWDQKFGFNTDRLTKGELASVPGATTAAPEPWTTFTSAAGGFSLLAPGIGSPVSPRAAPKLSELASEIPDDLHVYLFGAYLDGPAIFYFAGSSSLPEEIASQVRAIGPNAFLDLARTELAGESSIKVQAYRTITLGIHPGREIILEPVIPADAGLTGTSLESITITLRVYLISEKLYITGAIRSKDAAPDTDVAKYLDSFKLLPAPGSSI